MRVLDLMPVGFEERFPEGTLTKKGERILEFQLPEDASEEVQQAVADMALKALPRFTTAAQTIARTRSEAGAREAAIGQEFAPGSPGEIAYRRREFGRVPAAGRVAMQAATSAAEFIPIPGGQTTGREVPPPEGYAERLGRIGGSVAGFTAAALPATTALRGLGVGLRAASALGAGAAAAVPQGTPRERAIRAGVTAATAGVSGAIGEAAAERVAAPAAKMVTHAITGGAAFGAIQPQIESRALGEKPPGAGAAIQGGLEMTALNLLLGGRALVPGGRQSAPPTTRPGLGTPEAPATEMQGVAAKSQALTPDNRIETAANGIPDTAPSPVLGNRTPRQAFLQLAQERIASPDDIPAAIDWARRSVDQSLRLQQHLTPPPVPPGSEPAAGTSPRLTQELQQTLGSLAGDFSVEVPGVGRVDNAAFMPPLTRVYPWAPDPVRVVIVDRATQQVYPAAFRSVDQLGAAIERAGPAPVAPEARARVAALERNVAAGGPKAEQQARRLGRVKEQTGIAAEERGLAGQQGQRRTLAALERQIRERPNDKKVNAWRRRAADLRAQLIGRAPAAVTPEPALEPKKEVPGPRNASLGAVSKEESVGPPAQPTRGLAAPPKPASAPAPHPRREPAPTAPVSERVVLPNMEFRDEVAAQRVADGIRASQPWSEPTVIKTKKGFGIEAAPAPPSPKRSKPQAESEARPTTEAGSAIQAYHQRREGKAQYAKRFIGESRAEEQRLVQKQGDMFGGATALGGEGEPRAGAERPSPAVTTGEGRAIEAPARGEARQLEVRSQSIHRAAVFQQRETGGAAELVRPENIQGLLDKQGGFSLEEMRKRPILVWRDAKGEIGPADHLYVIDGHHRLELAQHQWAKREDGAWVKTGQADRDIPAVEIGGNLAYAKEQARVANLSGIPNSFTEQTRIAREMSGEGKTAKQIGEQLGNVSPGKAQAMVNFAHLDKDVREHFFPPGSEEALFGGPTHGAVLGKWAQRAPRLVTGPVQREFLTKAFDEGWSPVQLEDRVKGWHDVVSAATQEEITLPDGSKELRILMTPSEFAEHIGRVDDEIRTELREVSSLTKGMGAIVEAAKAKHDVAVARFAQEQVESARRTVENLTALRKSVGAKLLPALNAEARGETGALERAKVAIAAEVTKELGPKPASPPPGGAMSSFGVGEIHRAIAKAITSLREHMAKEREKPAPPVEPEPTSPEGRLMAALKKLTPLRAPIEEARTAVRQERIAESAIAERGLSGRARLEARKRAQAGELPKIDFQSVADALQQSDADVMMERVMNHPGLEYYEQINASDALANMLGEKGGKVPTPSEQRLLEVVFGPEFVQTILDARPDIEKARELGYEMANMPRSLMTAWDMSAALRQGAFLAGSYPKEYIRAVASGHRYFMDEVRFREDMEAMTRDPLYRYARRSELSLTSTGRFLDTREELFIGAGLAEKVPVLGTGIPLPGGRTLGGVRASERGYVGLLNKLRFDVFKSLWRAAEQLGLKPTEDVGVGRNIAKFVNAATGRGGGRVIEKHAGLLNSFFFSARFQRSRMHLLTPSTYVKMPWHIDTPGEALTRRAALTSLFTYAGAVATMATLAAWGGAQVANNPKTADFFKIRVGNVRYDLLAGFQQYIRAAINLSTSSREMALHLVGQGPTPKRTPLDVIGSFAETKLNPLIEYVIGMLRGTTMTGDKFDLGPQTLQLFLPMLAVDVARVAKEDPRQVPLAALAAFYGVGVQAYRDRQKHYIPQPIGAEP